MESQREIIVPLKEASSLRLGLTGSKARNLSLILNEGFRIPSGFCITTNAYQQFIRASKLYHSIDMELSRKQEADMRWEEIWDASLRLRSFFLKAKIPPEIEFEILKEIKKYESGVKFSVRSSSPTEDSLKISFAGIHDSYVNVSGAHDILEAVKLVWASLWTDRAILYRDELALDPLKSSMAVIIQKMEKQPISGLAFSRDPTGARENIILEVVEGLLSHLVDNEKQGEKWVINREGKVLERPIKSLINDDLLADLTNKILKIEEIFGYYVDVEWTGTGKDFTVLQVRPITSIGDDNEERQWYLTLTPHFEDLKKLSYKVDKELIPALAQEGDKLSQEDTEEFSRIELAASIKKRAKIYNHWKNIYRNEFIPFAHGIRNLGTYYNDLVKPENPYEFIELLKSEENLANTRNHEFKNLAKILLKSPLKREIKKILDEDLKGKTLMNKLHEIKKSGKDPDGFVQLFFNLVQYQLDISYQNQSIQERPEIILRNVRELSKKKEIIPDTRKETDQDYYRKKLYKAAGKYRRKEVDEVLRIGRLSWKLRDDDNILLGKVENQFIKVLKQAEDLLKQEGKLNHQEHLPLEDWESLYQALIDENFTLKSSMKTPKKDSMHQGSFKPRQLVGQPSSPGIVTGRARIIKSIEDFPDLKSGEIMITDAVEPQMTFLASLSSGIIERRGGMLVHSSIIARELGIPSVNGVSKATELIKNGDLLTVNGYLGLVIIGEPEFNLEHEQMNLEKTVRV